MRKKLFIIFILLLSINIISSLNQEDIIFQDDFNSFTSGWNPSLTGPSHYVAGGTIESPGRNEPNGWTGWIDQGEEEISIDTSTGRSSTPSLKIAYKPGFSSNANQIGLVKYLPQGYNELYLRYYFKFDNNFQFGGGETDSFIMWKWGRLWQNVSANDIVNNINLADENKRGAIVWGVYDDQWADYNPYFQGGFLANDYQNTNDCPQNLSQHYWYPWNSSKQGGFLTPHIGQLDTTGKIQEQQTWHSFEMHIKLASEWQGTDGIFEIWIDGIKQDEPTRKINFDYMTTSKIENGINYITLNDNAGPISKHWTSNSYNYIDDLVISESYIGPTQCPNNIDISTIGACWCENEPTPNSYSNIHTTGICNQGNWESTITQDITSPTITLISPNNNNIITSSNSITFEYSITDSSSISNCTLKINNNSEITDFSISKETEQTFEKEIPNSEITWKIQCYDANNNQATSSTNFLTINYSPDSIQTSEGSQTTNNQQTNNIIQNNITPSLNNTTQKQDIEIKFDNQIITKIKINSDKDQEYISSQLKINILDTKPNQIQEVKNAYKYLEINQENLNSEINIISFQVDKEWIINNDYNPNQITLSRFSNNAWEILDTKYIQEDDSYYYYEATTPGFSYFAIHEKEYKKNTKKIFFILILIIIFIFLILFIFNKIKNKKPIYMQNAN